MTKDEALKAVIEAARVVSQAGACSSKCSHPKCVLACKLYDLDEILQKEVG